MYLRTKHAWSFMYCFWMMSLLIFAHFITICCTRIRLKLIYAHKLEQIDTFSTLNMIRFFFQSCPSSFSDANKMRFFSDIWQFWISDPPNPSYGFIQPSNSFFGFLKSNCGMRSKKNVDSDIFRRTPQTDSDLLIFGVWIDLAFVSFV